MKDFKEYLSDYREAAAVEEVSPAVEEVEVELEEGEGGGNTAGSVMPDTTVFSGKETPPGGRQKKRRLGHKTSLDYFLRKNGIEKIRKRRKKKTDEDKK
jgi:hypothetical protein